jgi:hypothetical protein
MSRRYKRPAQLTALPHDAMEEYLRDALQLKFLVSIEWGKKYWKGRYIQLDGHSDGFIVRAHVAMNKCSPSFRRST